MRIDPVLTFEGYIRNRCCRCVRIAARFALFRIFAFLRGSNNIFSAVTSQTLVAESVSAAVVAGVLEL